MVGMENNDFTVISVIDDTVKPVSFDHIGSGFVFKIFGTVLTDFGHFFAGKTQLAQDGRCKTGTADLVGIPDIQKTGLCIAEKFFRKILVGREIKPFTVGNTVLSDKVLVKYIECFFCAVVHHQWLARARVDDFGRVSRVVFPIAEPCLEFRHAYLHPLAVG